MLAKAEQSRWFVHLTLELLAINMNVARYVHIVDICIGMYSLYILVFEVYIARGHYISATATQNRGW